VSPGSFADRNRGSAADRGYGATWVKLRRMIMSRDAGLCQPCRAAGRVTFAAQVDHIVPKARGGTDDPENLQAICRKCHQAKTDLEKNEARRV
jgi:5-methylcytosine-specific restriction protein A